MAAAQNSEGEWRERREVYAIFRVVRYFSFYALPSPPQTQTSPSPEMQFGVYTIR
jgi:hypothetical protein